MDNPRSEPNPAAHLAAHQWKKGQSGNPGGRRKGTSIKAVLKKVLAQDHNGKSYYQLLGELIYREAMKGKHAFLKEILDRVEGPASRVEAQAEQRQQVVYRLNIAVPPTRETPALTADPERENVRVVEQPGS